jgi:hypothetical protein
VRKQSKKTHGGGENSSDNSRKYGGSMAKAEISAWRNKPARGWKGMVVSKMAGGQMKEMQYENLSWRAKYPWKV